MYLADVFFYVYFLWHRVSKSNYSHLESMAQRAMWHTAEALKKIPCTFLPLATNAIKAAKQHNTHNSLSLCIQVDWVN